MTDINTAPQNIRRRIDAIQAHLDTLDGMASEDAAIMVTLSSTLAQLYQAEALMNTARSLEELATFANGIIALLDTPAVSSLLAQFGIGEDVEDEDEDEDEGRGT